MTQGMPFNLSEFVFFFIGRGFPGAQPRWGALENVEGVQFMPRARGGESAISQAPRPCE